MEKPRKPIEPDVRNYPRLAGPVDENSPFVIDYKRYQKELKQYEIDIEAYEQEKLIRLVKNANVKYILKKYKIVER